MVARLSYEQEEALTNELLDALHGQWDVVLPRVVPEIRDAIDAGHRRHVNCILPGHGGKDDFRIKNTFRENGCCICTCTEGRPIRSGIDLVMRVRSVDFITAKRLLMEAVGGFDRYGLDKPSKPPAPRPVRIVDEEAQRREEEAKRREAEAIKNAIARIWSDTLPLNDPRALPALRWFDRRRVLPIKWPIAEVRFHPSLRYTDDKIYLGDFPAIVCMLRDNNGHTKTLHRTYITEDGLKPDGIETTRKLFSVPNDLTCSGSAVQFDKPNVCLNLAEGLESALSARLLTGLPTWACLSKDLMRHVVLPDSVRYVTVWADKDRSDGGQRAAAELVQRLNAEGRKAIALLPPGDIPDGKKGIDWNDLVMARELDDIRSEPLYRQWDQALKRLLTGEDDRDPPDDDDLLARAFEY